MAKKKKSEEDYIKFTARAFVKRLGDSLGDWALHSDWDVTIFPDGYVNATTPTGQVIYDLTAGNASATRQVKKTFEDDF